MNLARPTLACLLVASALAGCAAEGPGLTDQGEEFVEDAIEVEKYGDSSGGDLARNFTRRERSRHSYTWWFM